MNEIDDPFMKKAREIVCKMTLGFHFRGYPNSDPAGLCLVMQDGSSVEETIAQALRDAALTNGEVK